MNSRTVQICNDTARSLTEGPNGGLTVTLSQSHVNVTINETIVKCLEARIFGIAMVLKDFGCLQSFDCHCCWRFHDELPSSVF
jgi:hypothetical protein